MTYLFALTRIRINLVYVILALICAIAVNVVEGVPKPIFYGSQIAIAIIFIILMVFIAHIDDKHAEIERNVAVKKQFVNEALSKMDKISVKCKGREQIMRKVELIIDLLISSQSSDPNSELDSESDFNAHVIKLERALANSTDEECLHLLDQMVDDLELRSKQLSNIHR